MAKNFVRAALLLLLAAGAAQAQEVTLRACNPGTTAVDVYFAQGGNVVSKHVAPAECAPLANTKGAMSPGLIAVGFEGANGQWAGVRRYERLPPNFSSMWVQPTTETLSVTHGATKVAIPAQFSFKPPTPDCVTYTRQTSIGFFETSTRCDEFAWDLNVRAYPETHEIVFQRFCQPCDDRVEAQKTAEQRAKEKQLADAERAVRSRMPAVSVESLPPAMRIAIQANSSSEEARDRYLESMEYDPGNWDRIGWSDVPVFVSEVVTTPNPAMEGSVAILQGTLSGMQRHNAVEQWFDVFFEESPDHKFRVCTEHPEVFADVFGANYANAMVGKKVEVEGRVLGCPGSPGILVELAHQIKLVGSAPGMVASATPPAFKFPEDPNRPNRNKPTSPPTPGDIAVERERTVNVVGTEMYRRAESRLSKKCADEANARFQAGAVDPIKERQVSAPCIARVQPGAEQAGEKARTCAREILTRDPKMQTAALYEGVTTCMQATSGSAQAEPSNAPARAPAPAQAPAAAPAPAPSRAPVAAPASLPSAPAATQRAATPAPAAPTRAEKSQACVAETMQKLGPNALRDIAAYQKSIQDCLKR
jgi:hypothetical protein